MAAIYSAAVKTARMQAVLTAIGAGGSIRIGTASMATTLATFPLNSTPGTVSGSVLSFSEASTTANATATGTAAVAEVVASDGTTIVVSGLTVGTSGTDVVINTRACNVGMTVTLNNAGTISHA